MKKKKKKNEKEKEKKYLRLNDIIDLLGISRTTFWKMRQDPANDFPPGKIISKKVQVWSRKEIEDWLENKKNG